MKKRLSRLSVVCLLVGPLSLVACGNEESHPDVTPAIAGLANGQVMGLVEAHSNGYADYAWVGSGDNATMVVTITNKTERDWHATIELGTKLEPAGESVQAMVVTKEIEVHLEPHDSQVVEVHVACLDISKDPPAKTDTSWSLHVEPKLAAFIACAEGLAPSDDPSMRPFFVQYSLWQARGATRQQWLDFVVHYSDSPISQSDAEETADHNIERFGAIVSQCPQI
jgi:hypothetical protein